MLTLAQSGFWERTGAWLDGFLRACADVSAGQANAGDRLQTAVEAFVEIRARVGALKEQRPFLAVREAATLLIERLEQMSEQYLRGLSATTPLEAQRRAQAAQVHLDAATDLIPALVAHAGLEDLEDATSPEDLIKALTRRAIETGASGDLVGAFAAGREAARVRLGRELPPGGAFTFLLLQPLVDHYFDTARFKQVVVRGVDVMLAEPARLCALAEEPHFYDDLTQLRMSIVDSTQQAWHILRSTRVPRQAVRACLQLEASLVEDSQLLCAALLRTSGVKTRAYRLLRDDNVSDLLRSIGTNGSLSPLVQGLHTDIRTAVAHNAYVFFHELLVAVPGG